MNDLFRNRDSTITVAENTVRMSWNSKVVFVAEAPVNLRRLVPENATEPAMPMRNIAEEYLRYWG
jgi:hypothetical protein